MLAIFITIIIDKTHEDAVNWENRELPESFLNKFFNQRLKVKLVLVEHMQLVRQKFQGKSIVEIDDNCFQWLDDGPQELQCQDHICSRNQAKIGKELSGYFYEGEKYNLYNRELGKIYQAIIFMHKTQVDFGLSSDGCHF